MKCDIELEPNFWASSSVSEIHQMNYTNESEQEEEEEEEKGEKKSIFTFCRIRNNLSRYFVCYFRFDEAHDGKHFGTKWANNADIHIWISSTLNWIFILVYQLTNQSA